MASTRTSSAKCISSLATKWGKQIGLRSPESVVEAAEEFVALLGGDDPAGAPVGRIGATFDQTRGFEVIEQVGHDRPVDAEVLGQGELAGDGALGGGGKDLVTPWPTRKVGHGGVGRLDIGPKDHAQAPPQVVGQCVLATRGVSRIITLASRDVHHPIIRAEPRSAVDKMLCRHDDLYNI